MHSLGAGNAPDATAVDAGLLARTAISRPAGGPTLPERIQPGMRITIAVTDATRPVPNEAFLDAIFDALDAGGVHRKDVTLLIALGMHRRTTEPERLELLGHWAERVRVRDAQGADPDTYRFLGHLEVEDLPATVPVHLHEAVLDCDLLLATGIVEPHQYAGFSGARKTVAIGCAGRETIGALHGIPFLEAPGTRLGRLDGNPLHRALTAIAERAGLGWVLNVARSASGTPIAVASGDPSAVLEDLVSRLEPTTFVPVEGPPFDLVVAGVGAPKDANLYQASRALTYLAFAPRPVIRSGGWVLIPAPAQEGAGEGPGEREFLEACRRAETPASMLESLREKGFGAGGQRAFMVGKALAQTHCGIVGALHPDTVRACHLSPFEDPAAAIRAVARTLDSSARVLVVPHALATIPLMR